MLLIRSNEFFMLYLGQKLQFVLMMFISILQTLEEGASTKETTPLAGLLALWTLQALRFFPSRTSIVASLSLSIKNTEMRN